MQREIDKISNAQQISDELSREKRKRRTAHEIDRLYVCTIDGWSKSYGSEGSLNQHVKNKHREFYHLYVENLNLNDGGEERNRQLSESEDSNDRESCSASQNSDIRLTKKRKRSEIE